MRGAARRHYHIYSRLLFVSCFGVRVSVTFHLIMCVNIIFNSVWVAMWPPFGKELLTRLTICSLCNLTICYFSYSPVLDYKGYQI